MYAQVRGNNQGIIKITTGGMNRSKGSGPITVERDTRLGAIINGHGDAGMLVLSKARQMASEKCLKHGFGIVGTNNTYTSTGCLAYYAEKLAEQGLIGVVLAQSPEFVAPAGMPASVMEREALSLEHVHPALANDGAGSTKSIVWVPFCAL